MIADGNSGEQVSSSSLRSGSEDKTGLLLDEYGRPLSKSQIKKRKRKAERARKKLEKAQRRAEEEKRRAAQKASSASRKAWEIPDALKERDDYEFFLERHHVRDVYDSIADQWDRTRYKPWPKVESFILDLPPGSVIADLGCGNGKNIPTGKSVGTIIGCDFSVGLLEICARRNYEVLAANALHLPYRSGIFDAALSIAVLHHISTLDRRRKLVFETMRVLKVGGSALFYMWAQEQDGGVSGHRFATQDVIVPFHRREPKSKTVEKDKEKEGAKSLAVATKTDSRSNGQNLRVFERFCHVYRKEDVPGLFETVRAWVKVEKVYFDCGNWCVVARKAGEPEDRLS